MMLSNRVAIITGGARGIGRGITLYEELKEPQYAPHLLLKKMVTAGWLGFNAGKGFYEYDQ